MDLSLNITSPTPAAVDHVTSTLVGPNGFVQAHDSHPEGESVMFSGLPGSGTYTLTSQAYADRDDHEVGDPVVSTFVFSLPTMAAVAVQ